MKQRQTADASLTPLQFTASACAGAGVMAVVFAVVLRRRFYA